MKVLITGAAGNLGSFLARDLLSGPHQLRLLIHRRELPFSISDSPSASVYRGDLGNPATLPDVCRDIDCIIHFAGVLFAPNPEEFLPRTNLGYVKNLVLAAQAAHVGKFILISFPHVEGETFPQPAGDGPTRRSARFRSRPDTVGCRTVSVRNLPG